MKNTRLAPGTAGLGSSILIRVASFAALIGGGCSDRTAPPPSLAERYAQAACMAEANCDCGLYDSAATCESEMAAKFEAVVERGVSVDEDCVEQYLASELFQGCPTLPLTETLVPECIAMVGTAGEGEPCVTTSLMTMLPGLGCQSGLSCLPSGVCGDQPTTPKQAGDPCNPAFPLSCGGDFYCEEAGTCAPRASDGEGCNHSHACALGSFCDGLLDGEGICTPQLDLGDDCDPGEVDSCAVPSRCNRTTLQCDDMVAFSCVNLAL